MNATHLKGVYSVWNYKNKHVYMVWKPGQNTYNIQTLLFNAKIWSVFFIKLFIRDQILSLCLCCAYIRASACMYVCVPNLDGVEWDVLRGLILSSVQDVTGSLMRVDMHLW